MAKIKIVTAPESYDNFGDDCKFIFLAGTIDNGDSYDWQKDICEFAETLDTGDGETYVICNPRRERWNPRAGREELREQIEWELKALKRSGLILMNILEDSKSPITLLEMGLFKDCPGLNVFCPSGFYRFMNVEVTCKEFGVRLYETNETDNIKEILRSYVRRNMWK